MSRSLRAPAADEAAGSFRALPRAGEERFFIEAEREDAGGPTVEVLTIVSFESEEVAPLREALRKAGGRVLEMQALDPEESRQAALPFQDRAARKQAIRRGWRIRAVVPAAKVDEFLSSLEAGGRMQLLHRGSAPSPWPREPGVRDFEIRLVR